MYHVSSPLFLDRWTPSGSCAPVVREVPFRLDGFSFSVPTIVASLAAALRREDQVFIPRVYPTSNEKCSHGPDPSGDLTLTCGKRKATLRLGGCSFPLSLPPELVQPLGPPFARFLKGSV